LWRLPRADLVARRKAAVASCPTSESKHREGERTDERACEWPLLFGRAALGDLLRRLVNLGAHRDTVDAQLHGHKRFPNVSAGRVGMAR
jgi:hypothetical protein